MIRHGAIPSLEGSHLRPAKTAVKLAPNKVPTVEVVIPSVMRWLRHTLWVLLVSLRVMAMGPQPCVVVLSDAIGSTQAIDVVGRVLEADNVIDGNKGHGRGQNLINNLRVLESDEVRGVTVQVSIAGSVRTATTDEDGFFRITLRSTVDAPLLPVGSHPITATVVATTHWQPGRGEAVVRVVADDAIILVSDIDDTVVKTNVPNKAAMVREVLLNNESQLEPVAGAAAAYQAAIAAGVAGVVYVSGSPAAFHHRLQRFLLAHHYPRGPIVLKNLGDDAMFKQQGYKDGKLEQLATLLPKARFLLVGDAGEHDPEIYAAFRARHPNRVVAVVIRLVAGADMNPSRFTAMTTFNDAYPNDRLLADVLK
jgi:phosphatidate phosphatase APP1